LLSVIRARIVGDAAIETTRRFKTRGLYEFNPPMYLISSFPRSRQGRNAAFRDITKGDDWYWFGRRGYDQTTGLGVPDWANFFDALRELEH
jgi:hypothetical protein